MTRRNQATAEAALRVVGPGPEADDDGGAGGRPEVKVGTAPETIRVLVEEINDGLLPDVYVTDGSPVHMAEVSGATTTGHEAADDDAPLPVRPIVLTGPGLAGLLAQEAYVYTTKSRPDGNGGRDTYTEETTPAQSVLSAVLARRTWPRLQVLKGVIGAPILRRDGTLLQRPGYDEVTGFYLASRVKLQEIPEVPTPEQVEAARRFLLDRFLFDFPWVDPKADRANYLGLLLTPILRSFTRCLTPFGIITATQPSSGKTILTGGPGLLYGQRVTPWPYSDEELRKAVTAVLQEPVGVVIFDNLAEGTVVDSPVLAQLLTSPAWSDRQLGSTRTLTSANDRLWLATGNNLRVGGDIATRTIMVRLDPDMPNPEARTGQRIPDLQEWITHPANQRTVLEHLLVLVVDWTRQGAPRRTDLVMRQFTTWAQAVGGLLSHHGIEGFLGNLDAVKNADEDEATWGAFLAKWCERHGSTRLTAGQLRQDAEMEMDHGKPLDQWDQTFITGPSGRLPNAVTLGRDLLPGRVGRHHGGYVLRSIRDPKRKQTLFWVETSGDGA